MSLKFPLFGEAKQSSSSLQKLPEIQPEMPKNLKIKSPDPNQKRRKDDRKGKMGTKERVLDECQISCIGLDIGS